MTKKIQVIEVREYVYTPEDEDYADYPDADTTEKKMAVDKRDTEEKRIKLEELADEITVISRAWRIIDEP